MPSSRDSRLPSSRRTRGVLAELPLEHFLPTPHLGKLGSSTKRPVSPGTPVAYSPAKRRILSEEGLFAVKNPFTTSVSAPSVVSPSHPAKTPQNMATFSDMLVGPDSPARRLDFGMPKNATVVDKAPMRGPCEQTDRKLAPSPEIKSRSRSRIFVPDEDEASSLPSQSQPQPPCSRSQSQTIPSSPSSSSQHQQYPDFMLVSRELPPASDIQSIHYPGFDVYQDPHIPVPILKLTSPAFVSALAPPLEPPQNQSGDKSIEADARELVKENLPPRRKLRRAAATPEQALLFSPPSAQHPSALTTPLKEFTSKEGEILTPRRLSIFGVGVGARLGKAQRLSQEERKAMRRLLEEEVNGEHGND